MKRLGIALFIVLAVFSALSAEEESPNLNSGTLKAINLQDCKVMLIFARVWKHSPLVEREKAAWIVMNSNGEYEAVDWLRTPQIRIAVWSGALPVHIVAQVHTHGDHLDPRPSKQDALVARELNIWVYTLTRKGIWKVGPDGMITQEIDRDWHKKTMEVCREN